MKILHKLLISFGVITALAAVFGYAVMRINLSAFGNDLANDAVTVTSNVVDDADRFVYEAMDVFRNYSGDGHVIKAIEASNKAFSGMADEVGYIERRDKEWSLASGITPFMRPILENELSDELRKRIRHYNERHGRTVFAEVFVTNRYGANVAMTGRTSDYRQDDEDWWRVAKDKGIYIGKVDFDESSSIYSVDIGIRIVDDTGFFIGVMKVVMNIESVIDEFKRDIVSRKQKIKGFKLLDSSGRNIYSTGGEPFLKDFTKEPFYAGIKGGRGYFLSDDDSSGDETLLYVYSMPRGYREFEGLDWLLIMVYDENVVMAPLAGLTRMLEGVLVLMVILSLITSFTMAKRLSKPLERLRDAAREIESGNRMVKIKAESRDEIGELAIALGHMTAELNSVIAGRDAEIARRQALEEELKRSATTDRLTGVHNRVMFDDVIRKEVERARRYSRPMALSICDIDHFKRVNDDYGHNAGDMVLKKVADTVASNMRRTSYLFRWGGEEFVIIVTEADLEGARVQAERIRKAVEALAFDGIKNVTISIGTAELHGDDTADSLLARADRALYRAKENGRNRIELGV